jgi:glycosyltransferase involved in cell wall biosynthesis
MKVLYDISVLGAGTLNHKARTGVFRVVESVAEELVIQAKNDLIFCSTRNLKTSASAVSYLEQNHRYTGIPFSRTESFEKSLIPYKKKLELVKKQSSGNLALLEKLWTKIQIRNLIRQENRFSSSNDQFIHVRDLEKAQIYHSPFYAIPSFIREKGIRNIFLTSYDMIPVLYPQFCQPDVIKVIDDVLKSITPETWVLCISHATRNDLLNYLGNRANPDRVRVTHLAASDTFYKSTDALHNLGVRKKYNIPEGPYILSLCTLEPRKNIEQAIRAFVKISKQENIQDLALVLVGIKGWMFDTIFEEIQSSKEVKDRIIITGFVPDEDLAPLYSEAMMFVYPTHYEGFGLPPLEAMKCGTPVVTSNTSSLPEVVGDAGLMVDPVDNDQLCESILSLYKNDALRKELAAKSLERSKLFSWERCARETIKAYQDSLQS